MGKQVKQGGRYFLIFAVLRKKVFKQMNQWRPISHLANYKQSSASSVLYHILLTPALRCSAGASTIRRHGVGQNLNITQSRNAIYGNNHRHIAHCRRLVSLLPLNLFLLCSFFFSIRCPIFSLPVRSRCVGTELLTAEQSCSQKTRLLRRNDLINKSKRRRKKPLNDWKSRIAAIFPLLG